MKAQFICVDSEDSTYTDKNGKSYPKFSIIAGDRTPGRRLKDNVELVFTGDDMEHAKKVTQDSTFEAEITEIRVGLGARMRLTANFPQKK